jgi:hypothetical protein
MDAQGSGVQWKASNLATALEDAFTEHASAVPERVLSLVQLIADLFDGRDLSRYAGYPGFADCLIERRFAPPTADFAAEAARSSPETCRCGTRWETSVSR